MMASNREGRVGNSGDEHTPSRDPSTMMTVTAARLSLERPAARAAFRPHPQAVEGDFTFVTIIHLIGFQLSGRRSGGCVCVRPPSFSPHQRQHKKMTNPGSVEPGTDCLLRRQKGLVWAPVCCHPPFLMPVALIPLDSNQCPWLLEPAHLLGAHLHWKNGEKEWGSQGKGA